MSGQDNRKASTCDRKPQNLYSTTQPAKSGIKHFNNVQHNALLELCLNFLFRIFRRNYAE
jgi:hypothetical protein